MALLRRFGMFSNLKTLLVKGGGFFLPLFLWGCSTLPTKKERLDLVDQMMASRQDVQKTTFKAQDHTLFAVEKRVPSAERVHVYIEGDGLAWIGGSEVSKDPTPLNPVGLRLALADADSKATVLYLARPCQYIFSPSCRSHDWTDGRFSEGIVRLYEDVITDYQKQQGALPVVLHGFSGGAALALLVAPRLRHVKSVVTFAGLYDVTAWTDQFGYLPLSTSLNPADELRLSTIPQHHFVSPHDEIVPPRNIQSYLRKIGNHRGIIQVTSVESVPDHETGWEKVIRDYLPYSSESLRP